MSSREVRRERRATVPVTGLPLIVRSQADEFVDNRGLPALRRQLFFCLLACKCLSDAGVCLRVVYRPCIR